MSSPPSGSRGARPASVTRLLAIVPVAALLCLSCSMVHVRTHGGGQRTGTRAQFNQSCGAACAAPVNASTGEILAPAASRAGQVLEDTCCYWEPSELSERGWELIRDSLRPKELRYFDDYTPDESFHKEGADPYFSIYADDERGYAFSYHARLPWREPPPHSVSVLQVTLPTEYLEERGADAVRALALDMGSRLPFASGHAGLALSSWYPVDEQLDRLRPVIFRHPGFDIRNASIHDNMGGRVDGIHWLNLLGQPVLKELGGASSLRTRLQCPTATVQEMGEDRVVVSTGACPEAGDLARGQDLPAYRELAKLLEPWLEPFPWRLTHFTNPSVEEDLRHWSRRFLDR